MKTKTIQYPEFGNLHPLNGIHGVVRYLCKGTILTPGYHQDPFMQSLGLVPQGEVIGRRWGANIKQ